MTRTRFLPACMALVLAACGASGVPSTDVGTSPAAAEGTPSLGPSPDAAPTGSAMAGMIDSCTLLTDEDISAATSEGVAERKPSTLTQVFASVCDYGLERGGQLTVSVQPSGGRQLWDENFAPFIGTEVLQEAVSGLGDGAGGSGRGQLMVLEDDVLFDLQYFGGQDRATVVRQLAEAVLARLPCLASGCAVGTPAPGAGGTHATDVCALLTADEVGKALGHTASAPEAAAGRFGPECRWTLATGSSLAGRHSIQLSVMSAGGRERFGFMSQGQEAIPGLGDDAVKAGGNTDGSVLAVVGDQLLTLTFSLPIDTVDPYPQLVPLVDIALSRMGG